jgi:hypothetical protein
MSRILEIICKKMIEDSNYIPLYNSYNMIVNNWQTSFVLCKIISKYIKVGTCMEIEDFCANCYTDINNKNKKMYFTGLNNSCKFMCKECLNECLYNKI